MPYQERDAVPYPFSPDSLVFEWQRLILCLRWRHTLLCETQYVDQRGEKLWPVIFISSVLLLNVLHTVLSSLLQVDKIGLFLTWIFSSSKPITNFVIFIKYSWTERSGLLKDSFSSYLIVNDILLLKEKENQVELTWSIWLMRINLFPF